MNEEYRYLIKQDTNGRQSLYRFSVDVDYEPLNPRDDEYNLGTMVCWYKGYDLGDEKHKKGPYDYFSKLVDSAYWENIDEEHDDVDSMLQYLKREKDYFFLPLNVYEHGGISIYSGNVSDHFDSKWDCSRVGWIYTTKEDVLRSQIGYINEDTKEYIAPTKDNWKEVAEAILRGEVKTYDMYLTNQTYQYSLEILEPDDVDENTKADSAWGWSLTESMGSIYSDKIGEKLLRDIADEYISPNSFISEEEANKYIEKVLVKNLEDINNIKTRLFDDILKDLPESDKDVLKQIFSDVDTNINWKNVENIIRNVGFSKEDIEEEIELD